MNFIWNIGGYSLGVHSFGDMKIWMVSASGLSRDALHIYIGLSFYLAVRIVLRRYAYARWAALAVVVAAAMSGEALDHLHELSRGLVCDVPEHYHDLWNTTLASFMLALLEPLWARKAPLADVDDAGND